MDDQPCAICPHPKSVHLDNGMCLANGCKCLSFKLLVPPEPPKVEQYTADSNSWFMVYCDCACGCPNKQTKVRERTVEGKVTYWCTYCFSNHRKPPKETSRVESC